MRRLFAFAALCSVAACGQQEPAGPPANQAEATSAAAPAEAGVPELAGQWQVTALDGRPVSAGSAMTATFAIGKVSISSGCVRRAWSYTQKRNVVSFAPDPTGSSTCEGRGTTAEQETAYATLQDASIAIFSGGGKQADLSGTGGNLTLRR